MFAGERKPRCYRVYESAELSLDDSRKDKRFFVSTGGGLESKKMKKVAELMNSSKFDEYIGDKVDGDRVKVIEVAGRVIFEVVKGTSNLFEKYVLESDCAIKEAKGTKAEQKARDIDLTALKESLSKAEA